MFAHNIIFRLVTPQVTFKFHDTQLFNLNVLLIYFFIYRNIYKVRRPFLVKYLGIHR